MSYHRASAANLKRMLASVGMTAQEVPGRQYLVKIRITRDDGKGGHSGLVSFGEGFGTAQAIESALHGQNVDWNNVWEKMMDADVADIMHT